MDIVYSILITVGATALSCGVCTLCEKIGNIKHERRLNKILTSDPIVNRAIQDFLYEEEVYDGIYKEEIAPKKRAEASYRDSIVKASNSEREVLSLLIDEAHSFVENREYEAKAPWLKARANLVQTLNRLSEKDRGFIKTHYGFWNL